VGGIDRTIKYGKLAPGNYIFRVMVRNSDGAWNDTMATLPFYVVPNWWNTTWFYTLIGVCLFVVLALTFWQIGKVRSRRKLAILERSRSIEQERNRIARDIHDDLGANLTQVTLLSKMVSDPLTSEEELRTKSQQIAKTTKSMVQSLETIVWAVRPENDSLRSLVEYLHRRTDELFENLNIRHRFNVQGNLPVITLYAELRHNIYLAYREVLTNALKHSGATLISIEIAIIDYGCHIVVADNGMGIQTDLVRSCGSGLKNIRLRMGRTGGRCEWQTETGQGTIVKLYFPLPLSSPN
jgi:signal transduction histidine kinase